jgi:hypothetical protein|tara:strand:+ start:134 stop:328 length:195 start_codon:yes stop_codon:yes gene_type:complete
MIRGEGLELSEAATAELAAYLHSKALLTDEQLRIEAQQWVDRRTPHVFATGDFEVRDHNEVDEH